MLPIQLIIVLIAGVGNIFLGLFTLLKNPKSATNRSFFFFSLVIAIYLLLNFQISQQATAVGAFFWIRMVMSAALFMNLSFFFLATTFPQPKVTIRRRWIWLAIATTILGLIAAQLGLVFVSAEAYGANGQPGPAMPLFLLHTLVFLGSGFVHLVRKVRKAVGLEKTQITLFLSGAILMFASILVTNLLFVLVFSTADFIGLLPLYTLIFLSFISYAIIRHRFLDIRLVVVRAVAYVVLVTLISVFYSLGLFSLTRVFTQHDIPTTDLLISLFLVLIITFSFRLVKNTLEKFTKNILYHQNYNTQTLLQNLSNILASTLVLSDMAEQVLKLLQTKMNISALSVVLISKDQITFSKSVGTEQEIIIHGTDEELAKLIRSVTNQAQEEILVFEEMGKSEIKQNMRAHNLGVILPLVIKDELIGGLLLGHKASGEIYSSEDIRLLEIFAPQLAVATRNALSYDEIRRFNVTLKEEIDKATDNLEKANERLKELDLLKDEFVSLASHELRTPMSGIKGSISAILEGFAGEISPQTRKFLTAAYNENDRLIRLVNNLLNSSRIAAGRFTFTVTDVDLNLVIKDIVTNMQMAAAEKKVYLKFTSDDQPLLVKADSDKIREVIINLIGNSLKFTETGGITVTAKREADTIVTSVADTGPGIKPEDLALLFQKFSQVRDGSNAKPVGGTGLGLYISKQIVEGLQGKIDVTSEVGKGTTFYFSLPVAQTTAATTNTA